MTASTVYIHGSVWNVEDIQDEIAWCKSQEWQFSKYQKERDHAHCRICWWAIGISEDPAVGTGYTKVGNHWLCIECYEKFIRVGA